MHCEWSWNPQVCLMRQGWVLMRGGAVTGFQLHSEICCSGLSVAAVSPVLSFLGYWLCFSGWSLLACFGFCCLHPPAGGFCYRWCWFVGDCFADSLGLRLLYASVFHFRKGSGLAWLCLLQGVPRWQNLLRFRVFRLYMAPFVFFIPFRLFRVLFVLLVQLIENKFG